MLVAGVGNVFLRDDGFGCEVARRLVERPTPPNTVVTDYGIGGIHLAYDLLDGYERLILVDTVSVDEEPGTIVVLELDFDETRPPAIDAHGMDPHTVMTSLEALGGTPPPTLLVGCRPAETGEGMGLSPAVDSSVDVAVAAVEDMLWQGIVTYVGGGEAERDLDGTAAQHPWTRSPEAVEGADHA